MKKIFAILLVVLLAISIVACDKKPVEPAPSVPGETNAPTDKVYNVVSLVNGNLGDKSFFDSAEAGLKKLASDGRITYKTIEMGGTDADQPKWQETLDEVAQTGEYDLIICGTYQMPDFLKETATNYPDQKFLIYDDNTYVGDNQNVVNLTYRQNDMGYLIGVFAALMTSETDLNNINAEKVVGFIGGIDSPVINDFLYGFLTGVKDTDAEVKVDTRYVNSYVDTATAKEMGLAMINDNNVDIIWGVAGLSGNGGAEAASETGKAWFIGVDSDQELTLPDDQAAITLTSGLKNIDQSLIWLFDEWDAGRTYWGKEVNLGLVEGGVGIVTDKNFATYAPQAVQEKVLEAEAKVRDGEIQVPSAIGDETDGVIKLRDEMQP
ncbi:MAG: BMP family ABC transporter substrate-binding protein [Clostridiales bacterium]|jgi:basic membrane protein A|nr:BMP family ABC transporter substrate-binding protein [Clostridiales bacterium]MDY0119080.1 BMP family ABC transporter substrate-binding protein [Clostridia bacterium]